MNPRDAASPRRHRKTSKSKACKDYEASMLDIQMPSSTVSLPSWKEKESTTTTHEQQHPHPPSSTYTHTISTTGSNASVAASITSASIHSSSVSVGGLAYIETPSEKAMQNSVASNHSITTSSMASISPSPYGNGPYGPYSVQYHPTNAANSVSSKSTTTSKHSQRSKSSRRSNPPTQTSSTQPQSTHPSNSSSNGPGREEQILFEQRLCDQEIGVAVKKIHSNGKSQLRFVKCVSIPKEKMKSIYKPYSREDVGIHAHAYYAAEAAAAAAASSSSNKRNSKKKENHGKNTKHPHYNMSHSLPSPNVYTQRMMKDPSSSSSSSKSVTSLMGRIGGMATGRKKKHSSLQHTYDESSPKSQYSKSSYGGNGINSGGGDEDGSNAATDGPTNTSTILPQDDKFYTKALTWGNKKKILIPLCMFVSVRKGKTTKRTKRNGSDASKLLSIMIHPKKDAGGGVHNSGNSSAYHGSLDIEAPTEMDRDKFAKAFSIFLNVPLEENFVGESVVVNDGVGGGGGGGSLSSGRKNAGGGGSRSSRGGGRGNRGSRNAHGNHLQSMHHMAVSMSASSSQHSMGDDMSSLPSTSTYNSSTYTPQGREYQIGGGMDNALLPNLTPSPTSSKDEPALLGQSSSRSGNLLTSMSHSKSLDEADDIVNGKQRRHREKNKTDNEDNNDNIFDMDSKLLARDSSRRKRRKNRTNDDEEEDDDASEVSSLTQGFDQEIVEELHQAIAELRAELEASRAEAARAVKVAEQAIQSAESCSSNDWNSTVTHKAAEAAAQAQKRSAEAISKQRQAEEKLAAEKKSALFWRKQAQAVEEDAGGLQTRLAVAEVERAEITEELEREKRKAASYIQSFKRDHAISEGIQRDTLANAAEQNKLLEIELDGTRRDLLNKANEVKILQDTISEL